MADEDVGYGKPPQSGRFKKGHSGNPRGRPKGSRNIATLVRQLMSEQIVVTINGKRKRMSKMSAFLTQSINRAVTGDLKAQRELREWAHQFPELQQEIVDTPALHERDDDVIAGILERIGKTSSLKVAGTEDTTQENKQKEGVERNEDN
jgi:hypothetical protein